MCVPDSWYKYSFDLFCFERWVVLEPLVCFATMAFGAYITQQGIYRQKCGQTLKGSFTIFLFLVRSHILNSNGVWYWWFCPEGPINAPNSRFLGFYFVPRDLDSQRHMGPWLAAQGTLTRSAGDLDSQRHGKSMALRVKVPCAAS